MPYRWTDDDTQSPQGPHGARRELTLWPHQSLSAKGMVSFVFVTFLLILTPTIPVLGTPILWGLLPFLLAAVWGLYIALQRNHEARRITEILTLTPDEAHLTRHDPKGRTRAWQANRYWIQVRKYDNDGPVPNYITLRGDNREVEIGAFLSEEERLALYDDLKSVFRHP